MCCHDDGDDDHGQSDCDRGHGRHGRESASAQTP